jgi:putative ABC transport system ATP-binding protein
VTGSMVAIDIRGAVKSYPTDDILWTRALRGADLAVADGEFVAVMGPSGCGKSTLLSMAAGLDRPDEGTVVVLGHEMHRLTVDQRAVARQTSVGVVFQFFNLLDTMTAAENVTLPGLLAGKSRAQAARRSRELLDVLGIGNRSGVLPSTLSGGERQRLAIARALANEPRVLLADEPTGSLDQAGGAEILELFRRLNQGGQTILMVTHDHAVASHAGRVVTMSDGRIVDAGTPQ